MLVEDGPVNDASVGSTHFEQTELAIFSPDLSSAVGVDTETPVSGDYTRASGKFTGTIDKVTINLTK